MRRDADPRARPEINQEIAPQEFFRDLLPVRNIQRHRAATLRLSTRRVDSKTGFIRQIDEPLRLPLRFSPDILHPDLIDNFVSRARGVERRNRWSAVQEPERIVRILDPAALECERP